MFQCRPIYQSTVASSASSSAPTLRYRHDDWDRVDTVRTRHVDSPLALDPEPPDGLFYLEDYLYEDDQGRATAILEPQSNFHSKSVHPIQL